jgi:CRP-like cAMP-binding protein
MSDDCVAILSESRLFSGFSPEQLEEVILQVKPKSITLKSHERVFKKGDIADSCWLIESGNLVFKRSSLRSPFLRMILNKGSVTGIQGLVDPGSMRAVGMMADGKVKLIEIPHEGIARLSSETQILLWRNISKILLRKLTICLSRESLDNRA